MRTQLVRRLLVAIALVLGVLSHVPPSPVSAAVPVLAGISEVDLGAGFGCARFSSGYVSCWGYGRDGQIGNGRRSSVSIPTLVTGIDDATDLAVGRSSACVLHEGGTASCWGEDDFGQLGHGEFVGSSAVPVDVVGVTNATEISAGSATFCVRRSNSTVACWGNNQGKQIVDDGDISSIPTPTPVANLVGVAHVAVGGLHACVVSASGAPRCWGFNASGQLGGGNTTWTPAGSTISPVGLTQVSALAAGQSHTCARGTVASVSTVACWGDNLDHQINSSASASLSSPVSLGQGTTKALAAGDDNTCVVSAANVLSCWGVQHQVPAQGVGGLTSVSAAGDVVCGVTDDTKVRCWGSDYHGGRGDAVGDVPGAPASYVLTPLPELRPLAKPVRLLDTRPNGTTVDGQSAMSGAVPDGGQITVPIAGRGGLPVAKAYVFNVTVRGPGGTGSIAVHRCSGPTLPSMRFVAGEARSNLVVLPLSADGDVCLKVSATTHVTLDAVATVSPSAPYTPVSPTRLLDTRPSGATVDGVNEGGGAVSAGVQRSVKARGRGGVPNTHASLVLNVTATDVGATGSLRVYMCSQGAAASTHLSLQKGRASSALVFGEVTSGSDVCVESTTKAHVMVDVVGWFGQASSTNVFMPMRIHDTRPTGTTTDGDEEATGILEPGAVRTVAVTHRWDQGPLVARTMALSITVRKPTGKGWITVWACGRPKPVASIPVVASTTRTNLVIVPVGDGDTVCVSSSVRTHLTVDTVASWSF